MNQLIKEGKSIVITKNKHSLRTPCTTDSCNTFHSQNVQIFTKNHKRIINKLKLVYMAMTNSSLLDILLFGKHLHFLKNSKMPVKWLSRAHGSLKTNFAVILYHKHFVTLSDRNNHHANRQK